MTPDPLVDRDRQAVYDAEESAFGGTTMDELLAWTEVEVLVAAVTSDPWWIGLGVIPPLLVRTRDDARTSCADGSEIRICPAGRTGVTVGHELSHHLTGRLTWPAPPTAEVAHGARFRATALRVAMVIGGAPAADQLATSWRRHRLSVADWHWDEPRSRTPRALRGVVAVGPR